MSFLIWKSKSRLSSQLLIGNQSDYTQTQHTLQELPLTSHWTHWSIMNVSATWLRVWLVIKQLWALQGQAQSSVNLASEINMEKSSWLPKVISYSLECILVTFPGRCYMEVKLISKNISQDCVSIMLYYFKSGIQARVNSKTSIILQYIVANIFINILNECIIYF